MGVLGEVFRELQRPDAPGVVERELGAEDVAAEAAEPAGVVFLGEARALLEQLGDLRQRQDDDEHRRERDGAESGDHHDAPALASRARGEEAQRHHQDDGDREGGPGAAGEREQEVDHEHHRHRRPGEEVARPPGHGLLHREHRGQHQEGAEHVGVLEGRARAAGEDEGVRAGEEVEIGDDAEDRDDDGDEQVALEQEVEPPLGVVDEGEREEQGGDRDEHRHRGPLHGVRQRRHRQHADQVAGVIRDEEEDQRQVGEAEREAGRREHHHGEDHHELVGRRLDEHDAAGRADEPHRGALQARQRGGAGEPFGTDGKRGQ